MSWEAWGSGPEPPDIEGMYRGGWESDENCEKWWKSKDPEKVFTFQEAVQMYEEWLSEDRGTV